MCDGLLRLTFRVGNDEIWIRLIAFALAVGGALLIYWSLFQNDKDDEFDWGKPKWVEGDWN